MIGKQFMACGSHTNCCALFDFLQLLLLKGGVGERLWFSFSTVINTRGGDVRQRNKLLDRLRAVPDNRLLIGGR
jgi:hypothetical protein